MPHFNGHALADDLVEAHFVLLVGDHVGDMKAPKKARHLFMWPKIARNKRMLGTQRHVVILSGLSVCE